MSDSKRSLAVPLVFCLLFSLLIYSQTYFGKRVDFQPPLENISVPAELELKARVDKAFGKLPIRFEANAGQTDERVKFLARDKGYSLFLTPEEAVMVLPVAPAQTETGRIKKVSLRNKETHSVAIRMSLLNANPAPKMLGEEELIAKSAYFIGSDPAKWQTDVANFGRVRYKAAYPGIDLIYYGNPHQLEYDFVVSPGAEPDVIKIKFEGQDAMELDEAGNLVLKVESGRVVQNAPIVYQSIGGQRVPVEGRYVLLGEASVGFRIGEYDREKVLTIDPFIVLSTYAGGSANDFGNGVAVDASGNVFIVGNTSSSDFPTTAGALQSSPAGGLSDVFIAKLNADGSALAYSTYLGGAGADDGNGIAVDSSGNAYVVGSTSSANFPTVGPIDAVLGGTQDGFVAKLNATGSALVYSTYLGGAGNDFGNAIAVDSSASAYVTGFTNSADFPFQGVLDSVLGGSQDAYVAKLNAAGSALAYSTYLGGAGIELGIGIAVDASGAAYVTGRTESADFPTFAAFDNTLGGTADVFVVKLNAAGSALVYSTYLGGANTEFSGGIAVDASGNAYLTGQTGSTDFPTASPLQGGLNGTTDAFVTKLNATGSAPTYSTYLGGANTDFGNGVAVDASGNVFIVGNTSSVDFPVANALQSVFGGGTVDAFAVKLNPSGSALTYSTYLGGNFAEDGTSVAVDASGNAYVAGDTGSSNFPISGIVVDSTLSGTQDAFVVKITESAVVPAFNRRSGVLSPYWQSEAGIYTFVSVNHPSLSGMNSQIGVAMTAVNQDGGLQGTLEFTLSANKTQRLFITPVNFSFNPQTNPDDLFLITGNSSRLGRLQFSPIASNPEVKLGIANSLGRGFPDITALTFWGAVVILNSSTGFAMEFVGDMQDSRAFSSANFSGVN